MAGKNDIENRVKALEEQNEALLELLKRHGIHLPPEESDEEKKEPVGGW